MSHFDCVVPSVFFSPFVCLEGGGGGCEHICTHMHASPSQANLRDLLQLCTGVPFHACFR